MSNSRYFYVVFLVSLVAVFGIMSYLNRNATSLRKAYNVYTAMYVLHAVIFFGILITLPITYPSPPLERYDTDRVETINDVKEKLKEQREDIVKLTNQVDQINRTINFVAFIFALFAPMLYYNLFKSNSEIEKLSGKRMGSFD